MATVPDYVADVPSQWRRYLELTKPKVVALITFTALVGALLAGPRFPPLEPLLWAMLGIALSAGCAATLNHVLDRRIDEQMTRTRGRPLPTGQLTTRSALAFATLLGIAGMSILALRVNFLTALLTLLSLIGYAAIYTLWLKRATPPILGWTAVTGSLDANALLLFLIIFVWTPPHFWSLAIARREEYACAGIPMLSVSHGLAHTRLQVLLYTVLLAGVTLLPYLTGMSDVVYLGAAVALNARFLYYTLVLVIMPRPDLPMRLFRFSISYLMWLFVALLGDRYLFRGMAG
jgi:heme o synthase